MQSMENLMVVPENAGGIIGKFFYYSLANILIPKEQFIRVGMDFGLPKFKPAKESKAGAYRNATTALKERIEVKDSAGTPGIPDLLSGQQKGGRCTYLSGTGEGNPECPYQRVQKARQYRL